MANSAELMPPSRSTRKRKASFSSSALRDDDDYEGDNSSPAPSARKKVKATPKDKERKLNSKPLKALPMASTLALAAEHDKMLIEMRDGGASWDEIRKKWKEMTGDNTAFSTLPNRYSRLKANFVVIDEKDNPILLEAKHEIEAKFEREKWEMIAETMVEKGAGRYTAKDLSAQYKNLLVFETELMDGTWREEGEGEDEEEEQE